MNSVCGQLSIVCVPASNLENQTIKLTEESLLPQIHCSKAIILLHIVCVQCEVVSLFTMT